MKNTYSRRNNLTKEKPHLFYKIMCLTSFLCLVSPVKAQTFAVIGDYGQNVSNTEAYNYEKYKAEVWVGSPYNKMAIEIVADMVKSWNPDFIVSLGDDSYWCRLQNKFEDNVEPFYGDYVSNGKFYPILGNHDYKTSSQESHVDHCLQDEKNGVTLWMEYFSKNRYYDYVEGDIHFFALNFNPEEQDGIDKNSKQALWLKAGLEASSSKFNVVYGHQPVYSSCPTPGGKHCSHEILQWPFQEWGADIVLNGDNHYYERNVVNNFTYIVNGNGGGAIDLQNTYIPGITKSHFPTGSADRKWGAMLFTIKSDNGYYLDVKVYDHARDLRDEFVIWPNEAQWRSCN